VSSVRSSTRPSAHAQPGVVSPALRRRAEELQEGVGSAQAFDVDYPLPSAHERKALPDVTSALVFVLVALGLFFLPLGATLMQNEAVAELVLSMQ
jgi:hypothetical protein